jgi:hypothetical protein
MSYSIGFAGSPLLCEGWSPVTISMLIKNLLIPLYIIKLCKKSMTIRMFFQLVSQRIALNFAVKLPSDFKKRRIHFDRSEFSSFIKSHTSLIYPFGGG